MIALALELSSPRGSVALLRDGTVAAARGWTDAKERSGPLFASIRDVLAEAGADLAQVDLFVAGRGPGNYSGMRVALTAAQALALPAGRPVVACGSGAALAGAVIGERAASSVAVVGDARRGQFWFAVFGLADAAAGFSCDEHTWKLCPYADLGKRLPAGVLIVTSEWDRVRSLAPREVLDGGTWLEGGRYPDAADIARLALARRAAGQPPEPPAPLYLHPAVMS